MKKEKKLDDLLQGLEMTVCAKEEMILLSNGGDDPDISISGNTVGYCPTTNNCNAGNCVKGCGSN